MEYFLSEKSILFPWNQPKSFIMQRATYRSFIVKVVSFPIQSMNKSIYFYPIFDLWRIILSNRTDLIICIYSIIFKKQMISQNFKVFSNFWKFSGPTESVRIFKRLLNSKRTPSTTFWSVKLLKYLGYFKRPNNQLISFNTHTYTDTISWRHFKIYQERSLKMWK